MSIRILAGSRLPDPNALASVVKTGRDLAQTYSFAPLRRTNEHPSSWSRASVDPIDHFHFTGPILSTDGIPIAKYNEHQNTWLGLLRPMWLLSMRIVEVDSLRAVARRRGHSAAIAEG